MTPEQITALCTGLVTIIASLSALFVSIKTGQLVKTDSLIKDQKLQDIHVLVNSRLTDAINEIADLKGRVAGLTGDHKDIAEANLAAKEVK